MRTGGSYSGSVVLESLVDSVEERKAPVEHLLPDNLRGTVVLRQPCPDDVEKMLGYFESLGNDTRAFFHPHDFDLEHAKAICGDTNPDCYRVVAEQNGEIVGYAWFAALKNWKYPTVGIGISDHFQGKRLGGALMDALAAEAKQRGLPGLSLTVYKQNERGIRLYASRGYRIVGEDGPQHVMELVLSIQ
jgi:ribosomal protein S18 acetylase RimI-like enzyme